MSAVADNENILIETINLLKIFSIYKLTTDCLTDSYEIILKQMKNLNFPNHQHQFYFLRHLKSKINIKLHFKEELKNIISI